MVNEHAAAWQSPSDPRVQIDFDQDGTFRGYDGCNRFSGDYVVEQGRVVIKSRIGTMRGCFDGEPWLQKMATAQVDAGVLVAYDSEGVEIGRLERVSQ